MYLLKIEDTYIKIQSMQFVLIHLHSLFFVSFILCKNIHMDNIISLIPLLNICYTVELVRYDALHILGINCNALINGFKSLNCCIVMKVMWIYG